MHRMLMGRVNYIFCPKKKQPWSICLINTIKKKYLINLQKSSLIVNKISILTKWRMQGDADCWTAHWWNNLLLLISWMERIIYQENIWIIHRTEIDFEIEVRLHTCYGPLANSLNNNYSDPSSGKRCQSRSKIYWSKTISVLTLTPK